MISQKWLRNRKLFFFPCFSWKTLCVAEVLHLLPWFSLYMCYPFSFSFFFFFQNDFIFNIAMAESLALSVGNMFTSLICFLQGQQREALNMLLLD